MWAKSPGAVTFTQEETEDILRAQVALLIHCRPRDVDKLSVREIYTLLDVHAANEEIQAWRASRTRR